MAFLLRIDLETHSLEGNASYQAQRSEGLSALVHIQPFPLLLFIRGSKIQQGQIALPAYSHNPCEEGSVLRQNVCKVESRDRRPKLATVDETSRHGPLDPLPCVGKAIAGEQRLHAEEIAVENGSEDDLVDDDFGRKGQEFGRIIKYSAKINEPVEQQSAFV